MKETLIALQNEINKIRQNNKALYMNGEMHKYQCNCNKLYGLTMATNIIKLHKKKNKKGGNKR